MPQGSPHSGPQYRSLNSHSSVKSSSTGLDACAELARVIARLSSSAEGGKGGRTFGPGLPRALGGPGSGTSVEDAGGRDGRRSELNQVTYECRRRFSWSALPPLSA
jgi:hypothetical protein